MGQSRSLLSIFECFYLCHVRKVTWLAPPRFSKFWTGISLQGSSITFRVLSWFPRPLVVEQDDQPDRSLTAHFTVGNDVNAKWADLTYLKNGWRSSQQLLHRWEMLPWPRPFQVVFVFSALTLRGPAGSLRAEVSVTRVTDDTKYQRISERALGSSGPMCGLEVFIGNSGSSPLCSATFDQML